jgi:hypothetical protein
MISRIRAALLPLLVCTLLLSGGCADGDPTDLVDVPSDLVVTWFATSLIVNGTDLMDDGTRVKLTLRADGSFEIVATRDLVGVFCEGVYDCTEEGDFTATSTEIVFDPDGDQTTLSATITPTTLNLAGSDEGETLDFSFVTVPIPDLIGTWVSMNLNGADGLNLTEGGSMTTLAITFEADGSYRFASTFSPPDEFCDVGTSCLVEGVYTVDGESGRVTFDPADVEPTTLQLSVQVGFLTISGQSGGRTADWSFAKPFLVTTPGEGGSWFAISLLVNGVDLTDGGTFQRLTLDEVTGRYQMETALAPAQASNRAVCGLSVAPDCTTSGGYTATINQIVVTDDADVSQTPTTLAMTTTSLTLRLVGAVGVASFDLLYVRVDF